MYPTPGPSNEHKNSVKGDETLSCSHQTPIVECGSMRGRRWKIETLADCRTAPLSGGWVPSKCSVSGEARPLFWRNFTPLFRRISQKHKKNKHWEFLGVCWKMLIGNAQNALTTILLQKKTTRLMMPIDEFFTNVVACLIKKEQNCGFDR